MAILHQRSRRERSVLEPWGEHRPGRGVAFASVLLLACAHSPPVVQAPAGWAAYLAADRAAASASLGASGDLLSRFGHASLVHDQARYAEARGLWLDLALQAAGERSPWSRSIAAFAAHRIDVIAQEAGGPREARAADLERAAGRDVGPEARAILAASAAVEWARLGRIADARRLAVVRGCPSRLRVAGPADGPPHQRLLAPWGKVDRGALVEVDLCIVPLRGAEGRGGVFTLSVDVESDRARAAVLWVDSGAPFAVVGTLHDSPDRFLARRAWLTVAVPAGRSRLDLRVVAGPSDAVSLGLLASDGPKAGIRFGATADAPPVRALVLGPTAPSAPPVVSGPAEAIAALLAAHERYRQGDADGARDPLDRLKKLAPRFAPLWALSAAVDLVDPALTPGVSRDRARASLARAFSLDPTMARAAHNLALIEQQDDRPEEAMTWTLAGRRAAPKSFRFALLEAELLLERGWDREAQDALGRAAALQPDACDVSRAAMAVAQRLEDVVAEESSAAALHRCDALADAWADWLRRRGRLAEARAEYARLIEIRPSHAGWRLALADVLVAQGEREAARAELGALLAEDPRAEEPRRRLADLALATRDVTGARGLVEQGLRLDPGSKAMARQWQAAGGHDPILAFRVDGRQAVRTFEADAWRPGREAPAVIVLDRTVLYVEQDGSTRSLTHNVMRVLSKEGIERFGEIEVPEDADVLAVRTLKADGAQAFEAQVIAGKDSLSAPDLAVGDYVEIEWIDRVGPSARYLGGFLADRFYFRSYDAPLFRTEYVVVVPDGVPLQIDRRADAPQPQVERRDGRRVLTFEMAHMDQLVPEPKAAPFLDDVPSVRVARHASWEAWQDDLRQTVHKNGRIAAGTERIARKLCRRPDLSCVDALVGYVGEMENAGSPLSPAAATFAERSGSRLMLLRAMLRAAGLRPEVWMARPRSADVAEGALPETHDFSVALLRLPVDGRELWLDPRLRRAPPGHLPPALRGASAVPVDPSVPAQARGRVGQGEGRERRTLTLDVGLRLDGSASIGGVEKLEGFIAAAWREALAQVSPERVREEFEQRWLGFFFPGLELSRLDIADLAKVERPLGVTYRFDAPQVGRPQESELRVRLGFFPALMGREYVGVSARLGPLEVDEPIDTVLRARVAVPRELRVESLPREAKLDSPFGRYHRRARLDGASIVVERELSVPLQRVAPRNYQAFVRFASAVDTYDAETAVLRRR